MTKITAERLAALSKQVSKLGWFSGFARKHGQHAQADWLDEYRGDLITALALITELRARRAEGGAEGVGAGLRQAAEICRQQAREFLDPGYATGQPLSSFNERFACGECVKAIEAAALSLQGGDR